MCRHYKHHILWCPKTLTSENKTTQKKQERGEMPEAGSDGAGPMTIQDYVAKEAGEWTPGRTLRRSKEIHKHWAEGTYKQGTR